MTNIADFSTSAPAAYSNSASKAALKRIYDADREGRAGPDTDAETFEAVNFLKQANPVAVQTCQRGGNIPNSPLGNNLLRQIAQLIKANVGLEAAFTDSGRLGHTLQRRRRARATRQFVHAIFR